MFTESFCLHNKRHQQCEKRLSVFREQQSSEFAPWCKISFFVLLIEQCSYSFLNNTRERWFGNQFLPTAPKAIIVRVYEREIKGMKERMKDRENEELNCGQCFLCFFFSASVGACFPKQGNHTQPLPYPLMSACLWPIRACDWLAILFHWFCQLYVNVLSLHTARPRWMSVVCVPCALAAVPCLYEQEKGVVKLHVH